jgi:hypothetical protein
MDAYVPLRTYAPVARSAIQNRGASGGLVRLLAFQKPQLVLRTWSPYLSVKQRRDGDLLVPSTTEVGLDDSSGRRVPSISACGSQLKRETCINCPVP